MRLSPMFSRLSPMFSGTSEHKTPVESPAANNADQGSDRFDPTKNVQSKEYYERFNPAPPKHKPFSISDLLIPHMRKPIEMQPIAANAAYRDDPNFHADRTIQSDAYYKSLYGE